MAPLRQLFASFKGGARDGLFHATVSEAWSQGRTTYGGLSAALALRGARSLLDDAQLPLRSAMVSFVGPCGGDVDVTAEIIRRGKTKGKGMAFVRSDIACGGAPATSAVFAFGGVRQSAFDEVHDVAGPPPDLPGPEQAEPFFDARGLEPTFTRNFDVRLAAGPRPYTDADAADFFVWVRHVEGTPAGGVRGVPDEVSLLALADMLPPAILPRFHEFAPVSSATWMVNFVGRFAGGDEHTRSAADGWYLLRSRAEVTREGYSSQDMTIWGAEGRPIVLGRQCVACFDRPRAPAA